MATVLGIVQELAEKFPSIAVPSSLIGTSNRTVKQLASLMNEQGRKLVKDFLWPELRTEFTYTLVADQESYPFPADFSRIASDTSWDRTQSREMQGGLSPREWQIEKSSIISTGVYRRYTIKGSATNQIFITPTPSATEAGSTLVFEYYSKSWLRPATWMASTNYAANSYTWYNGNYYVTTSGGTSGGTAPTHTTGSASDGGITWDFFDGIYDTIRADTDVPKFDEELMGLGTLWRFMRVVGLPNFQDYRAEYEDILEERKTALLAPRTVNLSTRPRYKFISQLNLPDTIVT